MNKNRCAALSCLALALAAALSTGTMAAAQAADAPKAAAAGLTLEKLYRAKPYSGTSAQEIEFSHSGRFLAYRWNPYGESGTDLYVYDTQTGKTQRLTSPSIMAAFDAPEDLERFAAKRAQKQAETDARQAREEAQAAYLRGEPVDLNQWDKADLEKVRAEVQAKWTRDEAKKAADQADADAEKQAMAALEARRAGKAVPAAPSASASAATVASAAHAASAPTFPKKEDWEWRDELKKWRDKNKLKPTDTYPGVAQIVWAHQKDELVFQYRGGLFRWQATAAGKIEPLQTTGRKLIINAYTADDAGYVFSDDKRVLRARFNGGGVEVVNRELIHPDDADKKYKIESTVISEDGRWMALSAELPAKVGPDGKPAKPATASVEIMRYDQRWAGAKKADREEVADDKRMEPDVALYIRRVPQSGQAPARQSQPVFTHAGGDVWFEMSTVAWAKDGSHYAFTTWEREKELLRVYLGRADEDAKPEVVLERRGDVGHEVVNVLAPRFTPDGKQLVLGLDEQQFRQPYAIDVTTRALRPLLKGDFEATKVLGFTADSKTMFVTANKGDFAGMNVWRVDMATGAMTALGDKSEFFRSAAVSDDGRLVAANGGNWASRPELKLLSGVQAVAEKTLTQSHDVKAWAAVDVLHPERFSFKNRAGDEIQGYVFKPAGWKATDKRPAVMYVYGGPLNDRHIVELDSFQQTAYLFGMYMASKHGYVMVTVDPRGHSNYGRKFSDANWEQPGKPQAEDLEDALNYAASNFGVDKARVGLTGWSFGGFQTQFTMYTKPDLFAAGIAGAGPTQWENYNAWYTGRTLGKTDRSKPSLKRFSLIPLARNLKKPLLLVHGMVDDNVLYQDTVNVYRALLESGKDALVDLYVDPEGVHGMGGAVKPVNLHRKFEAFWVRNLGEGVTK